jgi:hypothetical protein
MGKVFILGSGASKAAWDNQGPPLLSQFFSHSLILKDDALPENSLWEKYGSMNPWMIYEGGVWGFLKDRYTFDENQLLSGEIDLEKILSVTQADFETVPIKPMSEAYVHLTFAFSCLKKFTAEVLFLCMKETECPLHRRLAESLSPDDTIISFNYDLIMDRSLSDLSNSLWNQVAGYNVFPEKVGLKREGKPPIEWGEPNPSSGGKFQYLKLHGSLNWYWDGEYQQEPKIRIIPVSLFRGGDLRAWLFDGDEFKYEPFLVPPVYSKVLWDPLKPLWYKARQKLQSADEVIIIGYSFREADLHAIALLRSTISANRNLTKLIVVNPDPDVFAHVKTLFPSFSSKVERVCSFKDYVRSLD